MHDLLHHGSNIEAYDHHEFPGVVPRTFIGPLMVASFTYPLSCLVNILGGSKFIIQLLVRGVLASLVLGSFKFYRKAVENRLVCQVNKFKRFI